MHSKDTLSYAIDRGVVMGVYVCVCDGGGGGAMEVVRNRPNRILKIAANARNIYLVGHNGACLEGIRQQSGRHWKS